MTDGLLVALGLVALIKSAHLLVSGASNLASRYGISPLIVGLTVVSFGTSLPELLVTLTAGLKQNPDLAIANIIGSNIANVLLVLGIAAIIRPLAVRDSTVVSELPFSLAAALLVGFLANAALFSTRPDLSISRIDGAILLFSFALFMLYIFRSKADDDQQAAVAPSANGTSIALLRIALGIVGLYFGGQWTVDGAVGLALSWGVDDTLVGLTVIAIGTSSPELVASAVAAYRREPDIAIGNVVGSNIFNLLWVLGLTASIVELPFEVVSNYDLVMVIASSTLIILAIAANRNRTITRGSGIVFVLLYVVYLLYLVQRG